MVCTPGLEWWPVVFGEQKDKLDIGFQHKICYPLNDTERFEQNFDRGHAEKSSKRYPEFTKSYVCSFLMSLRTSF